MPKQNSTTVAVEATTEPLSNATLLDQIMAETKLAPTQEGYQVARQGVSAFIAEILKSHDPDQLINKHRVDQMIAELDRVLSKQMDAILHQPEFQQLESAWRSLKLLVDRTDFRENIKLEVLHVSKDDLLDDFENAADITCSGIYKHVYTAGYGQFGGEPVAAMVGNYSFGPSSPDIKLLSYMASVGAMAHAPFLAAPSPEFFNLSSFEELPNLKEIKDIFAGPRHAKWRAFRESEDARHTGLTGPRFMLRSAYHPQENPVQSFTYDEDISQAESGFYRTYYHALVEPQLARADLRSNWRIFQQKTVPQILELMLQRQGINQYELRASMDHQVREFCVQAGETDLAFIARLAAEEGFVYRFAHSEKLHKLIITDRLQSFGLISHGTIRAEDDDEGFFDVDEPVDPNSVPYQATGGGDQAMPCLRRLRYSEQVRTARQVQRDYTFTNPAYRQEHRAAGPFLEHQSKEYEFFDFL